MLVHALRPPGDAHASGSSTRSMRAARRRHTGGPVARPSPLRAQGRPVVDLEATTRPRAVEAAVVTEVRGQVVDWSAGAAAIVRCPWQCRPGHLFACPGLCLDQDGDSQSSCTSLPSQDRSTSRARHVRQPTERRACAPTWRHGHYPDGPARVTSSPASAAMTNSYMDAGDDHRIATAARWRSTTSLRA